MKTIRELHNEAMDIVFEAGRARRRENREEARQLYSKAFDLEMEALDILNKENHPSGHLGRSIMARGAATLAYLSGRARTAEKMACRELAEDPHPEIIGELRDLLEAIYFQPDNPVEADAVLAALQSAVDVAVAAGEAAPVTYSETYADVDYDPARPGFIVGTGERDDIKGYEVLVRRSYARGRRVEDAADRD